MSLEVASIVIIFSAVVAVVALYWIARFAVRHELARKPRRTP